jgi:hypothetical protein
MSVKQNGPILVFLALCESDGILYFQNLRFCKIG